MATVLIAISLPPAIDALKTGIEGGEIQAAYSVDHYHLIAKLEEILTQPVSTLEAAATAAGGPSFPTTYSDTAGDPSRRLVYLSPYDGNTNTFSITPTGLVWVRVEIENTAHALETLTTR